jgi:hypothetical protein
MHTLKERCAITPLLWLDCIAYTGALLADNKPPWLSTAECMAWLKKSQSLLHSDVVTLPMTPVLDAWIAAHPALQQALAATKPRAPLPLRSLLADAGLRQHLVELVTAARAAFPHAVLALSCLSPRRLVPWACQHAGRVPSADAGVDADDVDAATLYLADFLRGFGSSGLDAVLLEESASSEAQTPDDVQLYQTLFNLGAHYGWDIGLRLPLSSGPVQLGTGPGFAIGPQVPPPLFQGLPATDWLDAHAAPPVCPMAGFLFAEIPRDAPPEQVLQRLSVLRQSLIPR